MTPESQEPGLKEDKGPQEAGEGNVQAPVAREFQGAVKTIEPRVLAYKLNGNIRGNICCQGLRTQVPGVHWDCHTWRVKVLIPQACTKTVTLEGTTCCCIHLSTPY